MSGVTFLTLQFRFGQSDVSVQGRVKPALWS